MERDRKIAVMGGGAIFMVSINWLLFVAGLSNFLRFKKKKFPPEHQLLPAGTKKNGGKEWARPPSNTV